MLKSSHHQLISNLIESELNIGDQIQFYVTSNSMKPIIQIGDLIVAEVVPTGVIKQGDIIIIRRVDDFLTHRVISITKDGWLTKGDNNVVMDPIVKKGSLIGLVKAIHKKNQRIALESSKSQKVNSLLAKLGELEVRAFNYHRFLRFPIRFCIKGVQKFFLLD
jgi:signal peptidase I